METRPVDKWAMLLCNVKLDCIDQVEMQYAEEAVYGSHGIILSSTPLLLPVYMFD